jgi:hypothetical protein
MDIISHGLWGAISFGRRNRRSFWLAFLFGVLPDLLSFGIFTVSSLVGITQIPNWRLGPPDPSTIPIYVHRLYDVTHSFLGFAIIFIMLWFIFKRPVWESLSWLFHILLDIFTHSTQFFPTPFLWPFSSYRLDGIPWSHAIIFIPNVILLLSLYLWYFIIRPKITKKRGDI